MSVVEDLVRDEGFKPFAYFDHLGFLTIGIGFMIDPGHPGRIKMPRNVADLWLKEILKERRNALDRSIPWWRRLSQGRRDALQNMAYQLGVAGLLEFKNMLRHLEGSRYAEAAEEALDSKWAKQTPERAGRIYALLKNG